MVDVIWFNASSGFEVEGVSLPLSMELAPQPGDTVCLREDAVHTEHAAGSPRTFRVDRIRHDLRLSLINGTYKQTVEIYIEELLQ